MIEEELEFPRDVGQIGLDGIEPTQEGDIASLAGQSVVEVLDFLEGSLEEEDLAALELGNEPIDWIRIDAQSEIAPLDDANRRCPPAIDAFQLLSVRSRRPHSVQVANGLLAAVGD